ncbi:Protein kinase domain-containing protein [Aphelenchoides fujianensis]|nr:Protein kinase domain-containing protein [Aphelenchoides fujianensis]
MPTLGRRVEKSVTFHDFGELQERLGRVGTQTVLEQDEYDADDDHRSESPASVQSPSAATLTSERTPKKSSGRRGLPLNVSFSAWLQLFLAKRRRGGSFGDRRSADSYVPNPIGVMRPSVSLSVVHETCVLGSDGESLEVSPCTTSDQMSTSSCYPSGSEERYVPHVKLRQKPNRRWSEEAIQKRLSLPADIKLPQGVIEKLNLTPTLDNLTRKSRRASLSEIGFGKLETYRKILDLGEGTYATVWLGKSNLVADRYVAMKVNLREYMEEIESFICIENVKLFLVQLLRGLAYCHRRRILHRDLKPQNLLVNRQGELKLADFRSLPTKTYSNEVVTLWYRPPDVLLGSTDYSTHIDLWGAGCIFYEMLSHKPMFPGQSNDEQLRLIFNTLGTPVADDCPALCEMPAYKQYMEKTNGKKQRARSLIRLPRIDGHSGRICWRNSSRISALEAMHHPFLDCFPSAIFNLPDTESVLSLPGVKYLHDPVGLRYRRV